MKKGRKVPFFISEIFSIYFELIIFSTREVFFKLMSGATKNLFSIQ